MAKAARPGGVKTRLIADGVSAQVACGVHVAMLRCVLARLEAALPGATRWLAVDEPSHMETIRIAGDRWRVLPQGEGDLGARLERVWAGVEREGGSGRVAFFGVDSPDVPTATLGSIPALLEVADAAVGPVGDGGYWTLAAGRFLPPLVRGIAWGTGEVHRQTQEAAVQAGLTLLDLPPWHDVDDAADLLALRHRLGHLADDDAPLLQLQRELDDLLGPS